MPGFSDFRVPPASATEDRKSGWVRESIQHGENWLSAQPAYKAINEAMNRVIGGDKDVIPQGQSRVKIPRAKRQIRELVSIMANLRPTASNKTDNEAYYQQADILNKLDRWSWWQTFMDRRFRAGFQAAALTGTAYISQVYDPDLLGYGRGAIRTDVYGAKEVLLINPPKDHDIQRCYAVIIKKKVPLHLLHARYPLRAHEITPDYGVQAYTQKGIDYVQSFVSSPLKALSGSFEDKEADPGDIWPAADLFEIYIYDLSINMTGAEIRMGAPGTSWEYTVPAFGSDIKTGLNSWEGLPAYRKATQEDARIYPLRRKIEATSTKILYDDTSEWWHGRVPLVKFSFDDWWCEALGFPLTADVASIEDDRNELVRGVSDAAKIRLDPPLQYDENLVSERLALKLNPRQTGQRLKTNMQMGDAVKALLPPSYADLPNYIPDFIKYEDEQQDFIMGIRDAVAMMKARQIPSSDTLEKMAELAGPLAQDMTRNVELGMRDLGDFRRWYLFQFMPKRQRMQILGENGLAEEDFDFDPGTLIPSHMADEDPAAGPSRYSALEKARRHAGNFYYHVVANSMARTQSIQQKLIKLQLVKMANFPYDWWTMAEDFEIDGFGAPPKGATGGLERWVAQQHILRELAQEMQGAQPQKGETRGRKPSGNASPQIQQKSGGTRSTIATSR